VDLAFGALKMAFVSGPRQARKPTLAKMLLEERARIPVSTKKEYRSREDRSGLLDESGRSAIQAQHRSVATRLAGASPFRVARHPLDAGPRTVSPLRHHTRAGHSSVHEAELGAVPNAANVVLVGQGELLPDVAFEGYGVAAFSDVARYDTVFEEPGDI